MVAKDVHRVHQQVHDRTVTLEPLRHRKAGEFREVPLPAFVREGIGHYAATHGTFQGLSRPPKRPRPPLRATMTTLPFGWKPMR
ncbi:hypothetical protein [Streptomyces sp. NPDC048565]|uniref:hypothetical protein n=1 Tax=Streptomyces sp. NPDC048565 TaxID=3155266 RepID=UPI0034296035